MVLYKTITNMKYQPRTSNSELPIPKTITSKQKKESITDILGNLDPPCSKTAFDFFDHNTKYYNKYIFVCSLQRRP